MIDNRLIGQSTRQQAMLQQTSDIEELHTQTDKPDHQCAEHLDGIPQTMLWTLHNRASEAMRTDGILSDPDAIRIYRAIPYNYQHYFGTPDGSHGLRSRLFDDVLRPWLAAREQAVVVELACGLETQFQRCDDGRVRWLCVDVPQAIALRERFLPASERCRHMGLSALDLRWLDSLDPKHDVFITAQGLFMYFEPAQVEFLLRAIAQRLPHAHLMFDAIPRWFSAKTMKGFYKTKHYRSPPMPWGIDYPQIEPTLRKWMPNMKHFRLLNFGYFRGAPGLILRMAPHVSWIRNRLPSVVYASPVSTSDPDSSPGT